jgi:hypothetical protein
MILKNLLVPSHNALLGLAGSPGPPPGERGDHHQIREEEAAPLLPARQGHYHSGVERTLTRELQADNGYGRLKDEIDYENKTDKDRKRWSLINQYKDTLQLLEWQDKDNCKDKMELYIYIAAREKWHATIKATVMIKWFKRKFPKIKGTWTWKKNE